MNPRSLPPHVRTSRWKKLRRWGGAVATLGLLGWILNPPMALADEPLTSRVDINKSSGPVPSVKKSDQAPVSSRRRSVDGLSERRAVNLEDELLARGIDTSNTSLLVFLANPQADYAVRVYAFSLLRQRAVVPEPDVLVAIAREPSTPTSYGLKTSALLALAMHHPKDPRVLEICRTTFERGANVHERGGAAMALATLGLPEGRALLVHRLNQCTQLPSANRTSEWPLEMNHLFQNLQRFHDAPSTAALIEAASALLDNSDFSTHVHPDVKGTLAYFIRDTQAPEILPLVAKALHHSLTLGGGWVTETMYLNQIARLTGLTLDGRDQAAPWWKIGLSVRARGLQDHLQHPPASASSPLALSSSPVWVIAVRAGGAAERAGVHVGDRIDLVENKAAGPTPQAFWNTLLTYASGSDLKLQIFRDGAIKLLTLSKP